jgi:formyltetrahydrofolate deformylase
MESVRHVLLIACPDSRGLIHKVTGTLLRHGLNIVENHEFVDRSQSTFFMRTEFSGATAAEKLLAELRAELPSGSRLDLVPQAPKPIVLLATKEPHCLGDLLLRHASGELNAKLLAVISQYEVLRELTERFEIPFVHVPVDELSREGHEAKLEAAIAPFRPHLLVLAKYMRILTPDFVNRYENRIVNIHHSFLPAFVGKNPYTQAYERGVKIIGATAHFVNGNLDEGPIITQSVISITHSQDAAALARAGRDVEKTVLARALALVLENRVLVQDRRTLVFE